MPICIGSARLISRFAKNTIYDFCKTCAQFVRRKLHLKMLRFKKLFSNFWIFAYLLESFIKMRFITLRSFQNMHLTDHSLGLEHLICPVVILARKATGKPGKNYWSVLVIIAKKLEWYRDKGKMGLGEKMSHQLWLWMCGHILREGFK